MSWGVHYDQPNAADSLSSDVESKDEQDLQELDTSSASARTPYRSTRQRQTLLVGSQPSDQIPLHNLRADGLRGFGRRYRKTDGSREDIEPDEGLQDLLYDDMEVRDSTGSITNPDDTVSLLPHTRSKRAEQQDVKGSSQSITARIRLPSFMSRGPSNIGTASPHMEEHDELAKHRSTRNIDIGQYPPPRYPANAISNAKYTPWSFLPRTLYNEFSFFINLYFLLVALSQTIPDLRIGYLSTYIAPLAFVLVITMGKEALDDIARRRRDTEANREPYTVLRLRNVSNENKMIGKREKRAYFQMTKRVWSASQDRLSAVEEEEENVGTINSGHQSPIVVDEIEMKSRDLKVGDVLKLGKAQRVPADLVILKCLTPTNDTSMIATEAPDLLLDPTGHISSTNELLVQSQNVKYVRKSSEGQGVSETFIRTDQLDGETDWKLRLASPLTQSLESADFVRLRIVAGKPDKRVNEFVGTVELTPLPIRTVDTQKGTGNHQFQGPDQKTVTAPLTIDNTAWANTVLASSTAVLAVVVYTGAETRQALSTSASRSKTGLLELEINNLTKILCALTLTLSVVLVGFERFDKKEDEHWWISILRFLILFSTIIPISLRVNLDMGKSVYAWFIERDQGMPGAVVRTSTIPEDLGRIEYLLSDKTGTLTQNEMELKKIHVGTVSYANEAMDEVSSYVRQGFSAFAPFDAIQSTILVTPSLLLATASATGTTTTRTRREIGSRVRDVVLALALCHNVTPTADEEDGRLVTAYQASSPDEIAIVRWTESVGLRVVHRDRHSIALQSVDSSRVVVRVRILDIFPFTSDGKRMGIILQFLEGSASSSSPDLHSGEICFYLKGADTVMSSIVAANDWLEEETANMAREGLRTLVVGRKKLSAAQYEEFSELYKEASVSLQSRDSSMAHILSVHLEHNLELLGVTGVEDKLQKDVKPSLELLRNAGIKIWMLTGDKVETARCVAVQSKLVSRSQHIYTITNLPSLARTTPDAATDALSMLASNPDSTALLIDGDSLSHLLIHHRVSFITLAVLLPAVIACRCSPTQKAEIALLIRSHSKKRIACIGDGGNDVSMIQAADVGVGIVGKEGRQASLAADFSVTQFHHLTKLLVWHGRNSYKRSAKLAQFVIHRGLIISVCQTVYSIATHFEPHALYRDWLLVGYATIYTMAPVFSLVLDRDVDEALANLYPELYKELTPGRSLSYRTFFVWVAVSIYQGTIIQGLSQILVGSVDSQRMISVSFTTLVINELIMVAFEIVTWHWIMIATLLGTAMVYAATVPFLGGYFDLGYVWSWGFVWRVATVAAISLVPPYSVKVLRRTLRPPSYRKVRGI